MNQRGTKQCRVACSQFERQLRRRQQQKTASRSGIEQQEREEEEVELRMELRPRARRRNKESEIPHEDDTLRRRRRRGRTKRKRRRRRAQEEEEGNSASRCCCLNKILSCSLSPMLLLSLLFVFALSAKTQTTTADGSFLVVHHPQPTNSIQQQQQQTTSLPDHHHQPFLAAQQNELSDAFRARSQVAQTDLGRHMEADGNEHSILVHNLTPISASGSLAFVAKQQQPSSPSGGQQQQQTSKTTLDKYQKCLRKRQHNAASGQLIELLAVEGSSLKLNLVITTSQRYLSDSQQQLANSQNGADPKRRHNHRTMTRQSGANSLVWKLLRDNQEIVASNKLNQKSATDSQQQGGDARPASRTAQNSVQHRFIGRYLVSETRPETIRHLLMSSNNDSTTTTGNFNQHHYESATSEHHQLQQQQHSFMLSPYLNEYQLEQLEQQPQPNSARHMMLSSTIKRILSTTTTGASGGANGHHMRRNLVDNFLENGQQIDWAKLSSHLRASNKLFPNNQQDDELCSGADLATTPPTVEQFAILQLEFNQLSLADRGQYQLVLEQDDSGENCQDADENCNSLAAADKSNHPATPTATISIQLIEDVPRFLQVFPAQLLEPGDRLSIKCEATGFTLPQISWFLDGQQLSEQQQQQQLLALSSGGSSSSSLQQQQQYRIGDYVSQDNHVHSFVNSSSIRVTDGGFYKCQANNGFHTIEHEARIDVRGEANIGRQLASNVSVLVGSSRFQVQCPVSGHPVGLIEWYFKPLDANSLMVHEQSPSNNRANRIKRRPISQQQQQLLFVNQQLLQPPPQQQQQQQDDPDAKEDEWLAQAESMTLPTNPEDYPEPMQDYPQGQLVQMGGSANFKPHAHHEQFEDGGGDDEDDDADLFDYGDIQMDFQQQRRRRRRRSLDRQQQQQHSFSDNSAQTWIKLPQSRRHQVHLNGTLFISEINRQDFGLYKCHAQPIANKQEQQQPSIGGDSGEATNELVQQLLINNQNSNNFAWSNEMQLNVLVPPVISPFASSDSLREGMRNFLTCSVIEGDSPVKLNWLKDGRPIEEHLEQQQQQQMPEQPSRIRVEQTNEYTSTLYFSQVEFVDSGNYTCTATNKAASVNYTARMLVNVPPKWIKAPKDVECVSGQNIVIDCQAEAHPSPRIWWEIGLTQQQQQHNNGQSSAASEQAMKQQQQLGDKTIGKQLALNNMGSSAVAAALTTPTNNAIQQQQHPPNHYKTIISNSRIHILENASLVIREVSKQDQGYYLCQAANNFGLVSSLIKLTVNVGASFANKYQIKYVKLNEQIELDCEPSGQSPVTLSWFFRPFAPSATTTSHPPAANNDSSVGNSITRFHNHYFHHPQSPFQAANQSAVEQSSGAPGRRLFTATIRTSEPPVGMSAQPPSVDQHQIDAVSDPHHHHQHYEKSSSSSSSQPSLIELDSTMSFETLKRFQQHSGNQQQAVPATTISELVRLHIKQARRGHSGEYICQASNQFGGDEKLIKLFVQEPPDPIGANEINAVQVDSRSISLAWSAPFNGNSPIVSYLVEWAPLIGVSSSSAVSNYSAQSMDMQQRQQQQQNKWSHSLAVQQPAITLTGLAPMTSYEIRVRAQNQLGHSSGINRQSPTGSSPPPPFVVTTIEEAPSAPPGDIRALPLSSSSLQVSWLPPVLTAVAQQTTNDVGVDPSATNINDAQRRRSSIKGYYLGYKVANSTDPYIFKTVQASFQQQQPSGNTNSPVLPSMPVLLNKHINGSSSVQQHNKLSVLIDDLKRSTKYSIIVQAFNSAGPGPQSDPIEAKTMLNDPPPAPALRVGLVAYTNIELQWTFQEAADYMTRSSGLYLSNEDDDDGVAESNNVDDGQFNLRGIDRKQQQQQVVHQQQQQQQTRQDSIHIDGYYLYYRSIDQHGDWLEKKLSPETHSIVANIAASSALTGNGQLLTIVELLAAQQLALTVDNNKTNQTATTQKPSALVNHSTWQKHSNIAGGTNSSISLQLAPFKSFRFILDQLMCGNSYQIYLVAYNSFGSGLPSQVLRTKTRGSAPIAPRRQDFLQTVNTSFVQLNLDSWLDGGCQLNNFEIKYKQLSGRQEAASILMNTLVISGSSASATNKLNNNNNNWLLLSSNISPEQRSIELRDLQPETWYGIWATAESVAGKTDTQYAFMTLDRFGQLPSDAVELIQQIQLAQQQQMANQNGEGNSLPALFRTGGNGSLRSILSQFSSSSSQYGLMQFSPLLIGACLCLILFATCSLFLIRRYNNLISLSNNKDNISIDSRATSGALSSVTPSMFHHHHQQQPQQQNYADPHPHHHHHHTLPQQQHYTNNQELMMAQHGGGGGSHSTSGGSSASPPLHHEHYSMKVSPCRTGTATNNSTTTSTSNNSASALLLGGGASNEHGDMLLGGTNLSSCGGGGTDSAIGSFYGGAAATVSSNTRASSRLARTNSSNQSNSLIDNHYHAQPSSTVDLSQFIGTANSAANGPGLTSFGQPKQVQLDNNQQQFCLQQQNRHPTSNGNRFATLARTDLNCNFGPHQQQTDLQQQLQTANNNTGCQFRVADSSNNNNNGGLNHFKTLPLNQSRPVSSFMPNHLNHAAHHQQLNDHQINSLLAQAASNEQQQQIYSKLRLLHQHQCQPMGENICGGGNQQPVIHEQDAGECELSQQAKTNPSEPIEQICQLAAAATTANQPNNNELNNNVVSFESITANLGNLNGCQQPQQQSGNQSGHTCEQDDYALPFQPKWV